MQIVSSILNQSRNTSTITRVGDFVKKCSLHWRNVSLNLDTMSMFFSKLEIYVTERNFTVCLWGN